MSPTHGVFLFATVNTRCTRLILGSPGSTAFARLQRLVVPLDCKPLDCMTFKTRFSLTTIPVFRGSRLIRRYP